MSPRRRDIGIRRARLTAGAIVGALVGTGTVVALAANGGSVWRDLGLAVLSGGLVGGALVTVEGLLASAADKRAEFDALLSQLSTTIDLNGIDLADRDLSGIYLPGRAVVAARLSRVVLDDAKLYFCDLRHAAMVGASLRGADLSGSTLAFADLSGADLRSAVLYDVDLSDARLDDANLSGAVLVDARLQRTSFRNAHLTGTAISGSYLEGADFRSPSLEGARVEGNQHDGMTMWPDNYAVPVNTIVTQEAISQMSLAAYLAWRGTRE